MLLRHFQVSPCSLKVLNVLKEWKKLKDSSQLVLVFGIDTILDVKIINTDPMITGDATYDTIP